MWALPGPPQCAILAEAKDLAVVGPWRGGECRGPGPQPLRSINRLAGLGIVAGQETAVLEHVKIFAVKQRRRIVRGGQLLIPDDVLVAGLAIVQGYVPRGA